MKQIMLPHGERIKLAADLRVSRQCIWRALSGQGSTPLMRLIRKAAIERGGVEFDPDRRKRANENQ